VSRIADDGAASQVTATGNAPNVKYAAISAQGVASVRR
jgi:hypothetical protein